jgi:hypothetical protein
MLFMIFPYAANGRRGQKSDRYATKIGEHFILPLHAIDYAMLAVRERACCDRNHNPAGAEESRIKSKNPEFVRT